MSIKNEATILKKRALAFLDTAEHLIQKGIFDLACFNAEQAAQLYCKAALLEIQGDYPRTHSILELLARLRETTGSKPGKTPQPERRALRLLETAYITSRYFTLKFGKEDASGLISTAREVFKTVDQIKKTARAS